MRKSFISVQDLTRKDIDAIFALTDKLKAGSEDYKDALRGKSLALIFQKPSNRTRVSFEVGMTQLGGHAIYLGPDDIKLGVRETTRDVAYALSRYVDGIVARTFSHDDILELARNATVPVINGLSNLHHPCQAMADLYTMREKFKKTTGIRLAFVGDGNNVLHSLLHACGKAGISMSVATPKGYEPNGHIVQEALRDAKKSGAEIVFMNSAREAVKGADVIYTDVWTSMGQEAEHEKRLKAFAAFQVNAQLAASAKKNYYIMHCLPAHRGEEITDEMLDSKHSIVFDQAENRLHVQKAVMLKLLGTEW